MAEMDDWSKNDNKQYTGKGDRMYVSLTEKYELQHFIDEYLTTRKKGVTVENRNKAAVLIASYPGKAPIKRDDLTAHLDKHWK